MKIDWKKVGKFGMNAAIGVGRVYVPEIAAAEQAIRGVKTGPDKKKAVTTAVRASAELAEMLAGKEIVNEDLLTEGLGDINDAYVLGMKGYEKVMAAIKSDEEQQP